MIIGRSTEKATIANMRSYAIWGDLNPNPSDGKFTIFFGAIPIQKAHVQLYGIQGNMIFSETYYNTASAPIDLTDNPSGMYLMKIVADGVNYEEKFLKE